MNEITELKEHIRWLEDERVSLDAIDDRLDAIEGDLVRLRDAVDDIAGTLNALISISTPKRPAPLANRNPRSPAGATVMSRE